jgi:hypothetical protein
MSDRSTLRKSLWVEERFLSAQANHSLGNEWEENVGLLRLIS